jgi:hypothetical protein
VGVYNGGDSYAKKLDRGCFEGESRVSKLWLFAKCQMLLNDKLWITRGCSLQYQTGAYHGKTGKRKRGRICR